LAITTAQQMIPGPGICEPTLAWRNVVLIFNRSGCQGKNKLPVGVPLLFPTFSFRGAKENPVKSESVKSEAPFPFPARWCRRRKLNHPGINV
jgi:hypothetical protein